MRAANSSWPLGKETARFKEQGKIMYYPEIDSYIEQIPKSKSDEVQKDMTLSFRTALHIRQHCAQQQPPFIFLPNHTLLLHSINLTIPTPHCHYYFHPQPPPNRPMQPCGTSFPSVACVAFCGALRRVGPHRSFFARARAVTFNVRAPDRVASFGRSAFLLRLGFGWSVTDKCLKTLRSMSRVASRLAWLEPSNGGPTIGAFLLDSLSMLLSALALQK